MLCYFCQSACAILQDVEEAAKKPNQMAGRSSYKTNKMEGQVEVATKQTRWMVAHVVAHQLRWCEWQLINSEILTLTIKQLLRMLCLIMCTVSRQLRECTVYTLCTAQIVNFVKYYQNWNKLFLRKKFVSIIPGLSLSVGAFWKIIFSSW